MVAGIIFCVVGLGILAYVSDKFVEAAGGIAKHYGISPVIIGAVIIGFGTSAPEMAVSGLAAAHGHSDLGVGNIIGSNVANVTLVLGVAALVAPVPVAKFLLRREMLISLGAVGLFAILVQGGLHLYDGIVLLALIVVLLIFLILTEGRKIKAGDGVVWDGVAGDALGAGDVATGGQLGTQSVSPPSTQSDLPDQPDSKSVDQSASQSTDQPASQPPTQAPRQPASHPIRDIIWLLVGLGGTIGSAQLLVSGANRIADGLNLGSGFVGLTVVAVGTSLPELVTAAAASRRKMNEIVIGNILGSNIFNSLAVGGLVGVIGASDLEDPTLAGAATIVMLVCMLVMAFFVFTQKKVVRWEGAVLLAGWFAALPFTI